MDRRCFVFGVNFLCWMVFIGVVIDWLRLDRVRLMVLVLRLRLINWVFCWVVVMNFLCERVGLFVMVVVY